MKRGRLLSPAGTNIVWVTVIAIALVALMLLLTGCASPGPKIPPGPKEVVVEVIRPCIGPSVPEPPAGYADDGLESVTDPAERIKRRSAANLQRRGRLAILEPAVKACR